MSEIEKMERYIELTNIPMSARARYDMRLDESCAFYDMAEKNQMKAIYLAFRHGLAKGYRMAKAEVQR